MTVLGDVVRRVGTWNPSRAASAEPFVYVDLSSVDQDAKRITGARSIRPAEAPSRARQLIERGDVLVSTVRPNLNAVAYVGYEFHGATASTGFTVLRPSDRVDGRYLFHWVQTPEFVRDMVSKATGASYPAVSDRIVKESSLPLPPIEEQRRIAAILDLVEDLAAARKSAQLLRTEAVASEFDRFMAAADSLEVPLSDVVRSGTIVTYGIVQAGPEYPGGVPYIRTGDIQGGHILEGGLRHTAPEIAARFSRSRVCAGDLVMSIRATVGTVARVPTSLDGANLTQGTARIAPGDAVLPEYLLAYLRAPSTQRWIVQETKGATFREITLGRLRNLPVRVPSLARQQDLVNVIAAVELGQADSERQAMEMARLHVALQARAFSGRL